MSLDTAFRSLGRGLVLVAGILLVLIASAPPAAADHLIVEVGAPAAAETGESAKITVTARWADTGEPVAGATVVFRAVKDFAGVVGDAELGSAVTNDVGVAVFDVIMHVAGVQTLRVDVAASGRLDSEAVSIPVKVGEQLVRSESGVDIPGLGTVVLVAIVGTVWAVMLIALWWLVRVAHGPSEVTVLMEESEDAELSTATPGPRSTLLSLATAVFVFVGLFGTAMIVLFIRSPNTHSNLDPTGYDRTPLAFVEAEYLYGGSGPAAAPDVATDGQSLFLSKGCAGCHGVGAEGAATAPSPAFASREWLAQVVRNGQVGMPSYLESELSEDELDAVHAFLIEARKRIVQQDPGGTAGDGAITSGEAISFTEVLPIFTERCGVCHGLEGGWTATDYESVMAGGESGPVIVPGDPENSLLAQLVLGIPGAGPSMPPTGMLPRAELHMIIDWIIAGAPQ